MKNENNSFRRIRAHTVAFRLLGFGFNIENIIEMFGFSSAKKCIHMPVHAICIPPIAQFIQWSGSYKTFIASFSA